MWGGWRRGHGWEAVGGGGSIVSDLRAEVLGGERESQGEAKFRAPTQKYSKYSYADLDAHV